MIIFEGITSKNLAKPIFLEAPF